MLEITILTTTFILLSGVVCLVDAAVLSVAPAEVEAMVSQGRWGARRLRSVKQHMTRAVVVIVLVTNTINVLGPVLIGTRAVAIWGSTIIGVVTAVLTFGTVVFSEIIPKSLGAHHAPAVARLAAPGILVTGYILYPVVVVLEAVAGLLERDTRTAGTEAQIRALARLGIRAGHIKLDEEALIQRAFILNDRSARDVMTPLERVVSIPADATVADAARVVFKNEFSRYPVFGASADDFRGVVLGREIVTALTRDQADTPISKLVRPGLAVGAEKRSDDLLRLFRARRSHIAVVHDGTTTIGIVTLEDVLEELVGEIDDEKDTRTTAPRPAAERHQGHGKPE